MRAESARTSSALVELQQRQEVERGRHEEQLKKKEEELKKQEAMVAKLQAQLKERSVGKGGFRVRALGC